MRIVLLFGLLSTLLFSAGPSESMVEKLSKKGEKIVKALCEERKLPEATGNIKEFMKEIESSGACPPLSGQKLEAVAYFLSKGSSNTPGKEMVVPSKAKCPVCGMFVGKYPKWAAMMAIGGKKFYFDGVKDMMKYYLFNADFPYERSKISEMLVTDFYTLEGIDAKDAFYVTGSDLYGPMGNELIPFKTLKSAKGFKEDHKGEKIVRFNEISPVMVMALDGVEYHE